MDFVRGNVSQASFFASDPSPVRAIPAKAPPLRYTSERTWALAFGDATALIAASFLASILVAQFWNANLNYEHIVESAFVSCAVCLLVFDRLGLYRLSLAQNVRDQFYYVIAALCLTILPQMIVFTLFPAISTSRAVLGLTLLLAVPLVGAFRAISHALLDDRERLLRIAIVAQPQEVKALHDSLRLVEGVELLSLDAQSDAHALFERACAWGAQKILFAGAPAPGEFDTILSAAAQAGIEVGLAAPRLPIASCGLGVQRIGDQPFLVARPIASTSPAAWFLKRALDISGAFIALLIALPLMALIALALALEAEGRIIYRQERVGKGGRVFTMLKFRSMQCCAEDACGPVWAKAGDQRVTRLGALLRRTSLDELPQLFNVLRGDMSIVGPRPERPFFVEMFRLMLPRYDERHLVKPGITGWSQVHMPRVLDPSAAGEKLACDLFYIQHWSIFMDVSIICKTAVEFLFHKAA